MGLASSTAAYYCPVQTLQIFDLPPNPEPETRPMHAMNVEVRRHNGQCSYGPWMSIDAEDIPEWVADMILDEIIENGAKEGMIDQAGSIWAWRRS